MEYGYDSPQWQSESFEEMLRFFLQNRKIETIKAFKNVGGLGLKEAKDMVDSLALNAKRTDLLARIGKMSYGEVSQVETFINRDLNRY